MRTVSIRVARLAVASFVAVAAAVAVTAAGLAGASLPPAPQAPPGTLPDTRPGRLMAEWLAMCDKPDVGQLTRWHEDHLARAALKHDGAKAAAARDAAKCEESGGYLVTQVEQDGASLLSVFATGRRSQARSRLVLSLDRDGRIEAAQPAATVSRAGEPGALDIAGTWSGTAVLETAAGDTRLVRLQAELRADGSSVSGSITLSPPSLHYPLTSGALAGNRVTFSAERNVVVFSFDLAIVSADRMEGTMNSDSHGEEQSSGQVTFIRAPDAPRSGGSRSAKTSS